MLLNKGCYSCRDLAQPSSGQAQLPTPSGTGRCGAEPPTVPHGTGDCVMHRCTGTGARGCLAFRSASKGRAALGAVLVRQTRWVGPHDGQGRMRGARTTGQRLALPQMGAVESLAQQPATVRHREGFQEALRICEGPILGSLLGLGQTLDTAPEGPTDRPGRRWSEVMKPLIGFGGGNDTLA
jgi:hypothetical protein